MRRTAGTSSLEEVGCLAERSCLEILAVLCQFSGAVSVQAALTGDQSLGGLERMEVYLSWFWRLRKSKVRVLRDSASGEGLIPVSSRGGRVREPCGSFYQDTNPTYAGSTLMT